MHRNTMAELAIGVLLIAGIAQAQQPASPPAGQPQPHGRVSIPGSGHEIVFGTAEVTPRSTPRHTGPGVVMHCSDGEVRYWIDGQPGRPYTTRDASHARERGFPVEGQGNSAAVVTAIHIVERAPAERP